MNSYIGIKSSIEGYPTVQVLTRDGCVVGEYDEGSDKIPSNIVICEDMKEFHERFILYSFMIN